MDVGCCCMCGFEGCGDNVVPVAVGAVEFVSDKAGEESLDGSSIGCWSCGPEAASDDEQLVSVS